MSPKLPSENTLPQIPFQYVAMPAGSAEQDYVVAAFDVSQLKDRETPITFEFSGLSSRHKFSAFGIATMGLLPLRPCLTPRKFVLVWQESCPRRPTGTGLCGRNCPVSGEMLGSKGPVVKLYIADSPLYLSGEDCIAAVQQAPEKYLPPSP